MPSTSRETHAPTPAKRAVRLAGLALLMVSPLACRREPREPPAPAPVAAPAAPIACAALAARSTANTPERRAESARLLGATIAIERHFRGADAHTAGEASRTLVLTGLPDCGYETLHRALASPRPFAWMCSVEGFQTIECVGPQGPPTDVDLGAACHCTAAGCGECVF